MEFLLLKIALHMIVLSWIHKTVTLVCIDQPVYDEEKYDDCDNTTDEVQVPEDYYFQEIEARATEVDVTYNFYSKNHRYGVSLKHTSAEILGETDFSTGKYTLFVIHGWRNHRDSHFSYQVKEALLSKHDLNLFVVDWSPVALKNYLTAQGAVLKVGNIVARFVKTLIAMYGLKLSSVAFIGHSLGAHISGNAGAALEGKIEYIVGLDPASPLFTRSNLDNRLDTTDAKFVQVIHTNGGKLGVKHSVGHSDYYPNGGEKQRGCGLDVFGMCAHRRAWTYYAESVSAKTNLFVGQSCCSYEFYVAGKCKNHPASVMGGYPIDTKARGVYYLTTNKSPPFGRG